MLELKLSQLDKKADWQAAGVKLPEFDVQAMIKETSERPVWLHFGAGNIFRGFIAVLQQRLLEQRLEKSGIIASDTFDYDLIDRIYAPFDNLTLLVGLKPDGTTEKEIVASVGESLRGDITDKEEMARMKAIFTNPSLQMVSFTITEKGYALNGIDGGFTPLVVADMEAGPEKVRHAMSFVTAMLWERFKAGAYPIAMVSMDNCSHNGEKLKSSVVTVARAWEKVGFVSAEFVEYLENEEKVSFPWSMIDKITPRPAEIVEDMLTQAGIVDMKPIITSKNTFIAPFVNAEIPQYLVVEDKFPNGRPALEKAGVYMTNRETVNNTERMKVTTCLNPLHTALAVYGCLLGYDRIAKEMSDPQLKRLVEKIGYEEGMPVVVDPKILSPMDFIHEVINVRLPNPFVPDMPQRIATDTSQKVGIRFGETMKSYVASDNLDVTTLTYIPLVLAGWLRYLLAVDDEGNSFECSSDPMLETLQEYLKGVKLGDVNSAEGKLEPILSNEVLFGVNLYEVGLGEKIEGMFKELITRPGSVRAALVKYVG